MGLFNKLKNVLFEETEIDEIENEEVVEPKLEEKIEKATMNLPKIDRSNKKKEEKKKEIDYNFDDELDNDLFKIDKTFDFPAFDEDEFDDFIPKKKEEPKQKREERVYHREEKEYRESNRREEPIKKVKNEYSSTRIIKPTNIESKKKVFKPSPVISPVYGILDKNYKKEDVLTRDEIKEKESVKLDVDSVRKKAFGALEEDLANSNVKDEPIIEFYDDIEETIDNSNLDEIEENIADKILEETVDEEIDVTKEMELPTEEKEIINDDELFEEEQEVEITDDKGDNEYYEDEELDEIDELFEDTEDEIVVEETPKRRKKKEKTAMEVIDEQLEEKIEEEEKDAPDEDDLFELIDSMYENKEEE